MRAAAAAAFLVAAAAASARAAETVDLADLEARGWLREDWYGVFCDDVRVGWMRRSLARTTFEDRPAVAREVEVRLDVAGAGNHDVTRTVTVFAADGPQLLLRVRTERAEGERTSSRDIVRRGMRFDVVTERRGERIEGAAPSATVVLADELGFERAAAAAGRVKVAGLDPWTLSVTERTFSAAPGADGVLDVTVTAGGATDTARVEPSGVVRGGTLGPRFSYRRESEESAKDPSGRTTLEKLARVKVADGDRPAAFGDVARIAKVVLAWDDPRPRAVPTGPRQTVRKDGAALVVEVRRDADVPADDASRAEALADAPGLDLRHPAVIETVTSLLSGTSDRAAQADRLLQSVAAGLEKKVVLGTPGAAEILATRRGDCSEHARLFVALCRAAGIPARTVDGLAWLGDETGELGWHTWAEFSVSGRWIAVDPTTGANPAPATHVAVDPAPDARTLLWGARLRLVSVERDPPPPAPPPSPPR